MYMYIHSSLRIAASAAIAAPTHIIDSRRCRFGAASASFQDACVV